MHDLKSTLSTFRSFVVVFTSVWANMQKQNALFHWKPRLFCPMEVTKPILQLDNPSISLPPSSARMWMLVEWLSTISGMEWWNGTLEWNAGMGNLKLIAFGFAVGETTKRMLKKQFALWCMWDINNLNTMIDRRYRFLSLSQVILELFINPDYQ